VVTRGNRPLTLEDLLEDLWGRGIPVIPLDNVPQPSFQGIACITAATPVILLGHRYDAPGRVAYIIAHELGHIALGHCDPVHLVADEEGGVPDDDAMERAADAFATKVLIGENALPELSAENFRQLAQAAAQIETENGTDATFTIFSWAARTRDYQTASRAVAALYRANGARREVSRAFERHVNLDEASETDRALLECVLRVYGAGRAAT
jgi:Zn-dependent peptidase ImmA (M78 family)